MEISGSITARFRGKSEHTLDAKGRLNIPKRYRDVLRKSGSDVLMLTAVNGKCVRMYTLAEWEAFENKLLANKALLTTSQYIRKFVSNMHECVLDKQGRILLPASLRSKVSLGKEVVLNGMLEFAEIWPLDGWEQQEKESEESFANVEEALASMGML